jgi:hypothetical protein
MRDSYRRDPVVMAEAAEEEAFDQAAAETAAAVATLGVLPLYEAITQRPGDMLEQLARDPMSVGGLLDVAMAVPAAADPEPSVDRGAARATLAVGALGAVGGALGGRGPRASPPRPMRGPVSFLVPSWATPTQRAQMAAYVAGCNRALQRGQLSSTGRVSTGGSLRARATLAAATERLRAARAGSPYRGVVGHVPDTTWTGAPVPPEWLDLDMQVNSSLGGSSSHYPVGYQPTEFLLQY